MWIRTLHHKRHDITNDTRFQALTISATASYCKTLLYSKNHEYLIKIMTIQAILLISLTQMPHPAAARACAPAVASSAGMCREQHTSPGLMEVPAPNAASADEQTERQSGGLANHCGVAGVPALETMASAVDHIACWWRTSAEYELPGREMRSWCVPDSRILPSCRHANRQTVSSGSGPR